MFRLISEAQAVRPFCHEPKRETIIIVETDNIRERETPEPIHHREDDSDTRCSKCGKPATVWTGSDTLWEQHAARCGQ